MRCSATGKITARFEKMHLHLHAHSYIGLGLLASVASSRNVCMRVYIYIGIRVEKRNFLRTAQRCVRAQKCFFQTIEQWFFFYTNIISAVYCSIEILKVKLRLCAVNFNTNSEILRIIFL